MRVSISLALVGLLASSVLAGVSAHVYRADEVTPLTWADPNVPDVYQNIMVGTRLIVFIGSDTAMSVWSGSLFMPWEDWDKGTVSGRDYNEETRNCEGSILEASGLETYVGGPLPNELGIRTSLSVLRAMIGEWMVLDYHAQAVGTCNMGLYAYEPTEDLPSDLNPPFDDWPPGVGFLTQGLTFNHVASRDYDDDHVVNFVDFAMLASQWHSVAPADPNEGVVPDLNADDVVDIADLTLFCEYWLERTDIEDPLSEPNTPSTEP